MGRISRLVLTAASVVSLQFGYKAAAQNQTPHPTRLAVEVMGGAFRLLSPARVVRNYADYAHAAGAGVGVLFYEDIYVGTRVSYGQFDSIKRHSRDIGSELYFVAGELVGKVTLPRTGSDAARLMRLGPIAVRFVLLARSGIHAVGNRAGRRVVEFHGTSRGPVLDQYSEARNSIGGGGGVELRYGRQVAFFIDATYSRIFGDGRWTDYTPLSIGLRLAGGPP